MKQRDFLAIKEEREFTGKRPHILLAFLRGVLLGPFEGALGHLRLQVVFIPAPAVLLSERYRLVIVSLHALDLVLDQKLDHLVDEWSVAS
jgi:hypothetical protein